MNRLLRSSWAALAAALVSCAHSAPYTWSYDLPPSVAGPHAYAIGEGDLLDVRVYNEPTISGHARVRADGKVTIALIGDVEARGKTPARLAYDVQQRLQKFLTTPSVSVAVEESRPLTITVLGEVGHPGVYTLAPNAGVLQAIASAGGFSLYADEDEIFVVRHAPDLRVRFTYDALRDNERNAADFLLKNGDLVTVE